MSLLVLVLLLIVFGIVAHYVKASTKIDPLFKTIIYIVIVAVLVIYTLTVFGVWDDIRNFKVGT